MLLLMSSLVNNYTRLQNELNNLSKQINKFNYNAYFKYKFNRIIKCAINNFNIKDLFNILLYTFDYDFYILLTSNKKYKKYYNLQKLSKNDMKLLINNFINYYCLFIKIILNKL